MSVHAAVIRRVGGLEVSREKLEENRRVIRRVGGLEVNGGLLRADCLVIRRVGGLEVFISSIALVLFRYPPSRRFRRLQGCIRLA